MLLEDEPLTVKETSEFVDLVESTMDKALSALSEAAPTAAEPRARELPPPSS